MGIQSRLKAQQRASLGALDRLRRPLRDGDLVTLSGAIPPLWRVMEITPQLNPAGPPGLRIILAAQQVITVMPGAPIAGVLLAQPFEDYNPEGAEKVDEKPTTLVVPGEN